MSVRAIIVAALAVFGLQTPLCAFACTGTPASEVASDGTSQAESNQSEHEMPCHGGQESAPKGDTSSHTDCDCESVTRALASKAGNALSPVALAAFHPVRIREARFGDSLDTPTFDRNLRVPPPDILLLKSTLIV